jgi:hypothetical protein
VTMPAISENTMFRVDVKTALQFLAIAVISAATYTTLDGRVATATESVAELKRELRDLTGIKERAAILETRFTAIDQRLTRIDDTLQVLAQRRASLEPEDIAPAPRPARARR